MRPGQGVEMEMHAVKGFGKDHAKFSPAVGTFATVFSSHPCANSRIWSGAATASYQLLPHIISDEANRVPPHLATRFQNCFAPGVINVDACTKEVTVDDYGVRGEPMSREVLRHPDLCKFCQARACTRSFYMCVIIFSYVVRRRNILMVLTRFLSQRRVRRSI